MKHPNYYPVLLKKVARFLAFAVIVIAVLCLAGWQFNIEILKRPLPLVATMNPLAAVAFMLSGLSILTLFKSEGRFYNSFITIAGALVFTIGFLRLAEIVLGLHIGFDNWLYSNQLANDANRGIYNHIPPNAAINFLLTGIALLLVRSNTPRLKRLASISASIVLGIAMFVIVGYLYQVKEFFGLLVYLPMPVHGAICFLLLALSLIFYNADTGFMQIMASSYWGGHIARRMVPAIIIAPVVLGLLLLIVSWRYAFSTELVAAAIISCVVMFLFGIIWPLTNALNKSDAGRALVLEQLKHFNKNLEETVTLRSEALMATEKKFQHTLDSMIEGAQIIDFNWRYLYLNDAALKPTPYTREEMLGFTVMQKYPGIEQTVLFKTMQQCMDDRVPNHLETEFVFPGGTKMDFEISLQPVPEGLFILTVDITARKAAQDAMLKSNRMFAFISAVNQSIVQIQHQQVLFDNACQVAVNIGGFKMAWIGIIDDNQWLNMVAVCGQADAAKKVIKHGGWDCNDPLLKHTPVGRAMRTNKYSFNNNVQNDPNLVAWKPGFELQGIHSSISLPLFLFGKLIGFWGLHSDTKDFFDDLEVDLLEEAAQDISFALENFEKEKMRKQAEAQLIQNESLLKRAQGIAHMGHFERNLATGEVEWSEEMCRIFGLDPGKTKYTFNDWVALIHPNDVAYVLHLLQQQTETLNKLTFKYRIVRPDGTIRHMHTENQFGFDDTGQPVSLYGINIDVTEQRLAEQKLLRNQSQLKDAQAIAAMGSWQMDLVDNIIEWSDEQFNILGYKPGEVEPGNEAFFSMLHPDDAARINQGFEHAIQTFEDSSSAFRIIRKDGAVRNVFCEWKFEFDGNQKPTRMYGVVQDITAKVLAEAQREFDRNNLDALINNTTDLMWSVDLNYQLITYNKPLEGLILSFTGKQIEKGTNMLSYAYSAEQAELYRGYYHRAFAGETFTIAEYTGAPADGWAELSFYPIREGDNIVGSACYSRNITEKRLAEEKLQRSAAQLKEAQIIARLGSWEVNMADGVQIWSDELFNIYGLEKCTPTTQLYLSCVHPDDRAQAEEGVALTYQTGRGSSTNFRFIRKNDGALRYAHAAWKFEMDNEGNPLRLYGIVHDVTEQTQAQENLRRNQSQLKDAQAIAVTGSWQLDMVTNVVEWSDEQFKILGYKPGEVEPGNELFFSMVHPDDVGFATQGFEHATQTMEESSTRFRIIRKDGAIRYAYCEWKFELDSNQKPTRVYGILQDVTERKQHVEQQELFASIINSSDDAIISKTLDGIITSWNHGAEKLLGYVAGQIIGKHISVLIPPALIGEEDRILAQIKWGQSIDHYETQRVKRDGTIIYVSLTVSPIIDAFGTITGASKILRDITAAKQAENAIQQLNARLKEGNTQLSTILNTLPANITMLNENGTIVAINESWKKFAAENNFKGVGYGMNDNYIEVCLNATGAEEGTAKQMAAGISEILKGNLKEFELEYPCHSPTEKRWFKVEVRPLSEGKFTGAVVMHLNITQRKLAESTITEMNGLLENRVAERTTELTEANKALESFTYSVSHDLRAPVRSIVGFTKIIQKQFSKDFNPELNELFSYLESSGARMNAIIDDMLVLSKYEKEKLRLAPVNMEQLFNRVWANISYSTQHFAKLQMAELPVVEADMSMLEQVVVNLVSNAIKYSSKKEQPLVTVACEKTGGHYTFSVRDNGAGFDMKNYHRMFGAFQRLHSLSEFEGTGVGLLLVKKIVEKHGGIVWAEGKVNEGATFYFTLPSLPG